MKENYLNFNNFGEVGDLNLPDVPVQLETKKRILNNILLESKKKNRKNRLYNYVQILKPALFAACILFILFIPAVNYNLIPQSINDGYFLTVEANVDGAEVYFGNEKIDLTPVTQKIEGDRVDIRVLKEGFFEWKGSIKGELLDEALNSIYSPGKYRLFKGHNSIKLIVELDEILKNTLYLESKERGKVIVNGNYLGQTPLFIELQPKVNKIEVIQPLREKVFFEVIYEELEDRLIVLGKQKLQITEKGYTIYVESEDLFFPINGTWLEEKGEKHYLLLESNGKEERIKSINLISGEVGIRELTEVGEEILKTLRNDKGKAEQIIDLKDYPSLKYLLEDFNILHISQREDDFIIFTLDNYVNIWIYSLQEGVLQKIY